MGLFRHAAAVGDVVLGLRPFPMACLSGPSTTMEGHRKMERKAICTDGSIDFDCYCQHCEQSHLWNSAPVICSMTGAADSDLIRSGW